MGPFSTDRGYKTERSPDLIFFLCESFYEEMKLVKPECRDLLKALVSEMQSSNPRFSFGEKTQGKQSTNSTDKLQGKETTTTIKDTEKEPERHLRNIAINCTR